MNYFGIFPSLKPSQPILTSFLPMSYLPWDLKGEFMSFFWCSLWLLFVSFSLSLKLAMGYKQIQHVIIDHCLLAPANHSPSWPCPSLWTTLSLSEPAEPLSNDSQIVCLSHALGQPLLNSAPFFTNWLLPQSVPVLGTVNTNCSFVIHVSRPET